MSKYTTEVRHICEYYAGREENVELSEVEEVIEASRETIFGDYPIFDEDYRETLEKKILKHYFMREICEETVGLWRLRLNTRMNEIMPYYNKLYRSELFEFNPLYDVNLTTTSSRKGASVGANSGKAKTSNSSGSKTTNGAHSTGSSNSESQSEGDRTSVYSDTPQGGLSGVVSGNYMTNATVDHSLESGNGSSVSVSDSTGITEYSDSGNSESSSANTSNVNTTDDYIEKVVGYRGKNASELISKFREILLNIDMRIINDLSDLFFGLW